MDCPDQGERYHGGVIAGRRQALGAHSRSERDSTLIDGLEQSRFIGQLYDPARRTKKLNDRSWPFAAIENVRSYVGNRRRSGLGGSIAESTRMTRSGTRPRLSRELPLETLARIFFAGMSSLRFSSHDGICRF
jgi:hypothetical protein